MGLECNDGHGPERHSVIYDTKFGRTLPAPQLLFVPGTISVPKSEHRIYGSVTYHSLSPKH
jgi:hypothetical protein